jgi:hypothetical protein
MALWQHEQTGYAETRFDGAYGEFPDSPERYRGPTLDATLAALFQSAVNHANSRIEWYGRNAKIKSSTAKRLRKWSLILFAVGTIAPISVAFLMQIAEKFGSGGTTRNEWNTFDYFALLPMAEVGYLLLAVAGALIIFDQFFDSSGSWIRFRQSEARLQVLLAQFRFAWAALMAKSAGNPNETHIAELASLVRDFVTKVELLAEEETTAWAQRFSERLSGFDRNPNLKVTLGNQPAVESAGTVASTATSSATSKANGSTGQPESENARQGRAREDASTTHQDGN